MRLSIIFVFVIFVLHLLDFARMILTNTTDSSFFIFRTKYIFDIDTAVTSAQILFLSIAFLLLGNYISLYKYKLGHFRLNTNNYLPLSPRLNFLIPLYVISMISVLYAFILGIFSGDFGYSGFTKFRIANSFIFEIRFIPLVISYYIIVNREWFRRFWFRLSVIYLIFYFTLVLISGTRSLLIEIFPLVYIYLHSMSTLRFYNMFAFGFLLVLPIFNFMIYQRLGLSDVNMLFDNIFKIEYSKLLNNFYSSLVLSDLDPASFFMIVFQKLVPSVIRDAVGVKDIWDLNITTDVLTSQLTHYGGGSSGLAELYAYFGWFSFIIFIFIGVYLGRLCKKLDKGNPVSLLNLGHLYLFVSLLLLLRNSLDIYVKNFIQIAVILMLMEVMTRIVARRHRNVNKL
jgi:hypothetical protein